MERLMEGNWKALLAKPKNLGLKAQGTGISAKLKDLGAAEKNYGDNYNTENAGKVIKALDDLGRLAGSQSGKHKGFTEATKYLKEMVEEAKKRTNEVKKDIATFTSDAALAKKVLLMSHFVTATSALAAIKTADDFRKKGNGTLHDAVSGLMKICPYQKYFGECYTNLNSYVLSGNANLVTTANLKAK